MADETKEAPEEKKDKNEKEENEEGEKGEETQSKPLMKWVLIGVLGLAAVSGGAMFFMKGSSDTTEETVEAEVVPASLEEVVPAGEQGEVALFDLEPFIVNLNDPEQIRYLKMTIKLHLASAGFADPINRVLPQIRDSLLILLSSKAYDDIRSVDGKMELRDEIVTRVNTALKSTGVRTVYFTEFVAQ